MPASTPGNIDCPVCHVKIGWNPLPGSNSFRVNCPNCGMGFIYMNGTIVNDPKFSRK